MILTLVLESPTQMSCFILMKKIQFLRKRPTVNITSLRPNKMDIQEIIEDIFGKCFKNLV